MNSEKMNDYICSIFNIFKNIHKNAEATKNVKMNMISLTIYNYVSKMAKDNNFSLKDVPENNCINLVPFLEYVSLHKIEFYDFDKIKLEDVDITKSADLERFVLSHIYYITKT
jgi:UV DNA damage repair endonuclease